MWGEGRVYENVIKMSNKVTFQKTAMIEAWEQKRPKKLTSLA